MFTKKEYTFIYNSSTVDSLDYTFISYFFFKCLGIKFMIELQVILLNLLSNDRFK